MCGSVRFNYVRNSPNTSKQRVRCTNYFHRMPAKKSRTFITALAGPITDKDQNEKAASL